MSELVRQAEEAVKASSVLMTAGTVLKNKALYEIAAALSERKSEWLEANEADMKAAEASGIKSSMLDRLRLTPERIDGIADGIMKIISLPDPIGVVDKMSTRPNGLIIGRRRVPLGVIAIIYES